MEIGEFRSYDGVWFFVRFKIEIVSDKDRNVDVVIIDKIKNYFGWLCLCCFVLLFEVGVYYGEFVVRIYVSEFCDCDDLIMFSVLGFGRFIWCFV